MEADEIKKQYRLRVIAPGREFLLPYIEAELPEADIVDKPDAEYSVAVGPLSARLLPKAAGTDFPYLICPNIVGTGMTGFPMEVAKAVYSGRYYYTSRSDNPISLIHALDVAKAVRLTLGHSGTYTVTDLAEHTVGELATALAKRLDDRRITRHRTKFTRLLLGDGLRREADSPVLADGSVFAEQFDFHPLNVTEYLSTHVYSEHDL